jgi:hypothetical protein
VQEVIESTEREAREQRAVEKLLGRIDYDAIARYREEVEWGIGPPASRMPGVVRELTRSLVHDISLSAQARKAMTSGGITVTITETTARVAFDEKHGAPLSWMEPIES